MDMICCGNMAEEKAAALGRVGRSNSTLLASELVAAEAARAVAYSRLSQSMRVCNEPVISRRYDNKRKKNNALAFLLKVFSFKSRGHGGEAKGDVAEKAAEQKNPRRRWPLQGWGKDMENEGKAAEVLVENKKRKQPIWIPTSYQRWPVQGW